MSDLSFFELYFLCLKLAPAFLLASITWAIVIGIFFNIVSRIVYSGKVDNSDREE